MTLEKQNETSAGQGVNVTESILDQPLWETMADKIEENHRHLFWTWLPSKESKREWGTPHKHEATNYAKGKLGS